MQLRQNTWLFLLYFSISITIGIVSLKSLQKMHLLFEVQLLTHIKLKES